MTQDFIHNTFLKCRTLRPLPGNATESEVTFVVFKIFDLEIFDCAYFRLDVIMAFYGKRTFLTSL